MTLALETNEPQRLIDEHLFSWHVARITRDNPEVDCGLAERIALETYKFLAACAAEPEPALSPSHTVDKGWHALLLNTRAYSSICGRVAVRFIHHVPHDYDIPPGQPGSTDRVTPTIEALRRAGFEPDLELWSAHAAECSDGSDDCSASGPDGNENQETRPPGR
ncbi:hypothetical protein GCM10012275_19040 [Longimycelium tulufanense]|uniref:Uncharacterized protein n=1 Tax=Longimycelium tulufanense TaxID=907463 RepID=A0A8J3FTC2_9PSEU|nr:hypothetical protein GCM10012275_19040 [Longimycelium tulufanense]